MRRRDAMGSAWTGEESAYGVVLPRTLPATLAVGTELHMTPTAGPIVALVVRGMVLWGLIFELPAWAALIVMLARAGRGARRKG